VTDVTAGRDVFRNSRKEKRGGLHQPRGGGVEECRSAVEERCNRCGIHRTQDVGFAAGTSWNREEASVAAGGVGKRRGLGRLLLGPIGIEEIKDATNRPITH
jgi:hypothetical protein